MYKSIRKRYFSIQSGSLKKIFDARVDKAFAVFSFSTNYILYRRKKKMKQFYTAEELKKLFESEEWKKAHEGNVSKYFKRGE